mmetsp:Transcript_7232/g.12176  ORF Transcript_7232/g.12176 Transcript_7232/m.12176 type:complete len:226 (-) Transcript_7232:691-1368(-)
MQACSAACSRKALPAGCPVCRTASLHVRTLQISTCVAARRFECGRTMPIAPTATGGEGSLRPTCCARRGQPQRALTRIRAPRPLRSSRTALCALPITRGLTSSFCLCVDTSSSRLARKDCSLPTTTAQRPAATRGWYAGSCATSRKAVCAPSCGSTMARACRLSLSRRTALCAAGRRARVVHKTEKAPTINGTPTCSGFGACGAPCSPCKRTVGEQGTRRPAASS